MHVFFENRISYWSIRSIQDGLFLDLKQVGSLIRLYKPNLSMNSCSWGSDNVRFISPIRITFSISIWLLITLLILFRKIVLFVLSGRYTAIRIHFCFLRFISIGIICMSFCELSSCFRSLDVISSFT